MLLIGTEQVTLLTSGIAGQEEARGFILAHVSNMPSDQRTDTTELLRWRYLSHLAAICIRRLNPNGFISMRSLLSQTFYLALESFTNLFVLLLGRVSKLCLIKTSSCCSV